MRVAIHDKHLRYLRYVNTTPAFGRGFIGRNMTGQVQQMNVPLCAANVPLCAANVHMCRHVEQVLPTSLANKQVLPTTAEQVLPTHCPFPPLTQFLIHKSLTQFPIHNANPYGNLLHYQITSQLDTALLAACCLRVLLSREYPFPTVLAHARFRVHLTKENTNAFTRRKGVYSSQRDALEAHSTLFCIWAHSTLLCIWERCQPRLNLSSNQRRHP